MNEKVQKIKEEMGKEEDEKFLDFLKEILG